MKSILVIGLGRFGRHLAAKLTELGNAVMVVDKDEAAASNMTSIVAAVQIGDCMDETVLRSLGVGNFDTCFVCIGSNFQSSLEITSLLKDNGSKHVVAKADRDIHAKFLLRNGADEVIYPERDMAQRAAIKYSAKNAFEYIELTPEYAIFEIETPQHWIGKSIRGVGVRSKYNINIIALKSNGAVIPMTNADHVFLPNEHLIIAGNKRDSVRLLDKR